MLFKQVVGQEDIKSRLVRMVKENHVSHALLFTGPEGNGKLALAIAFAQYLNCLNPGEKDSCGECSSCKKYAKLVHPDLHFVFPVIKSNAASNPVSDTFISEWRKLVTQTPYFSLTTWLRQIRKEGDNKQGAIFTSESSEIIRKLSLKTFEGKRKVMIVWMPEKMNESTANKLLKVLEEPSKNTIFILVSNKPDEMISTILSRTQQLKIPAFTPEEIKNHLIERYQIAPEEAEGAAKVANGNLIFGEEQVKRSEENEFFFDRFIQMMRHSYARKVGDLLKWVEEMSRHPREMQRNFLNYSINMIRENYIMNFKQSDIVYLTPQQMEWSQKFSPFINDKNAMTIAEDFALADSHIGQNGNSKIVLFDLGLRLIISIKEGN
ncbi:DNA polymerase III subunit [Saccharicrinis fermentans]|uniref:DNA polymerase III subunit tau n=1 Tax=Saccharicrinis fermentans DSM 9555 = JCM 21142 TaxID=869213 RepID=W7Y5H3_9BACT|nr:DNA polymerase III subunit delta' [Saccharicrinis fermentans]GAF02813.1 DNA polymerase III subunit tau [Saccharicrinis fermentans DSM 9555 = JCM 21142]